MRHLRELHGEGVEEGGPVMVAILACLAMVVSCMGFSDSRGGVEGARDDVDCGQQGRWLTALPFM